MPTATVEIPLTRGKVALIDRVDYPLVSKHKWHAHCTNRGYWSARTTVRERGRGRTLLMHHLITGYKPVDHINRDSLDNRRQNLRYGPQRIQNLNRGPLKGRKYKGAYWHKHLRKWQAVIEGPDGRKHLGTFGTVEEAALAYNAAALEAWGSLAVLNEV